MAKERGYGIPRNDVERAIAHYGITESEYCANPGAYPLPSRGTGFTTGRAAGSNPGNPDSGGIGWGWIIIGIIVLIMLGRK